MRLEKYAQGSALMSRMNLPTGFYHLSKTECPELDFDEKEVFVIFQAKGPQRDHHYHVSFRKDVHEQLEGRNILACEVLGFDENCNAVDLPHTIHLNFTRELRREMHQARMALFYEIDLEMRLRTEMKNTLAMVPILPTSKKPRASEATIYILGLPSSMVEEEIFDLCSGHGEVVSLNLQRDRVGASLGIAFVGFARQIDSFYAMKDLLGLSRYWMKLGMPPLKVGVWTPEGSLGRNAQKLTRYQPAHGPAPPAFRSGRESWV